MLTKTGQKIIGLLSSKKAVVACILIAILSRSLYYYYFFKLANDRVALILTSQNIIDGKGMTIARVFMNDLSEKIYVPFVGWPPLYPFLLAMVIKLFDNSQIMATYLLDIISCIIYFIYLWKITSILKFPLWSRNLFILIQGFLLPDYVVSTHPTDLMGLGFVLGFWYYIALYNTKENSPKLTLLKALIFAILASFIRYQYIPVCVAPFLFFGIRFLFIEKNKKWKALTFGLIVLTSAIAVLLLVQKQYSSQYVFLPDNITGFFPRNILKLHPVVTASLVNIDFLTMQLTSVTKYSYTYITTILRIINYPVFFILLFSGVIWIFRFLFRNEKISHIGWVTGCILSTTLVLELIFMSLTQTHTNNYVLRNWTYLAEGRYFALAILFLQLAAWSLALKFIKSGTTMLKASAYVLLIIFFIESLHGVYLIGKVTKTKKPQFESYWIQSPRYMYLDLFIREHRKNHPEQTIIVTSINKQFAYFANWKQANGFFSPFELNDKTPKSSKPSILVTVIEKKELQLFSGFLQKPGVTCIKQIENTYFFTLIIKPESK